MGPTVTGLVHDPLAVICLDNKLYMLSNLSGIKCVQIMQWLIIIIFFFFFFFVGQLHEDVLMKVHPGNLTILMSKHFNSNSI